MGFLEILGIIAGIVISILAILLPIAGMFMWNRAEANADRRDNRAEANADRRDISANLKAIQEKIDSNMEQTRAMIAAIQQEMKDFHARLCVIESKRPTIILNEPFKSDVR